ncbi:MAG TPA: hypothetical protein VIM94_05215 [Salegentibacter sp.]|uniref:Ig-like domain-containing protein n=1 Tax=Salegentibacter sp. TaxID=1903072 RepID=UPI002F95599D
MKDFTLFDDFHLESYLSLQYWQMDKFLKKIMLISMFVIPILGFSQNVIVGTAPISTPEIGFGVDGDAYAGTPDYEVGDWFFSKDVNYVGPATGIFIQSGSGLAPYYENGENNLPFTIFLQDDLGTGGSTDNTTFTGSNKVNDDPNTYTWGPGNNQPKDEIQNVAVHFNYGVDDFSTPLIAEDEDVWCVFAADRAVTNGDSYIDFEFLQASLMRTGIDSGFGGFVSDGVHGGRTLGDILISVAFNNGGAKPTVLVYEWSESGGGYEYLSVNEGVDFYATSNLFETEVPFPIYDQEPIEEGIWQYDINQWVEGAFNITDLFGTVSDDCTRLSTLFVRTRASGQSVNSELSEFPVDVIQLDIDLTPSAPEVSGVENCGPWSGSLDATGCEGTVKWYDAEMDGNLLYTGASYTPENPITETTSFWVSCTVDGCEGPRAEVIVTIYEIPDFDVTNLESCEEGETGGVSFDLNDAISNEDIGTLTFYTSYTDTMIPENAISDPGDVNVLLTESPATFWARLDNDDDGDENCHTVKSFTVTVYDNPDLVVIDLEDCEDGATGYQSFDLNDGVTTADGNVTFYPTEEDAINETNALTAEQALDVDVALTGATYWVRSENTEDATCYTIDSFDITVYDNPDITTTTPEFICVGDSIDLSMYVSNPDGGNLSYYDNMTAAEGGGMDLGSSIVTPDLGENIYWVRSELTYDDTVCYSIASITVTVQECITCETAFAYGGDNATCFSEYPELIPNDSRWGWTNYYESATDDVLYLYAGESDCEITGGEVPVGEVEIEDNGDGTIDVIFTAYDNYILSSVHLYVGCEPLQYKKQGKNYTYTVAPGQYNMNPKGDIGYVTSYTIENIEVSDSFYLIAHADVCTSEYPEIIEDLRAVSVPGVYTLSKRFSAMQKCISEEKGNPNKTASTLDTQSAETTDGFHAWPVPFTDVLNIEYDFEFTADATIEIYDFKGQFLRAYEAAGVTKGDVTEIQIDFALRSNQVYIVNVTANGNRYSKTVISGKGK